MRTSSTVPHNTVPLSLVCGTIPNAEISDLAGVKIGVFPEWFTDADPQVVKQSQLALEYYVSRGAELVNITIPHLQTLSLAHSMKICSEFAMGWDLMYSNGIDLIEPQTNIVIGTCNRLEEVVFITSTCLFLNTHVCPHLYMIRCGNHGYREGNPGGGAY